MDRIYPLDNLRTQDLNIPIISSFTLVVSPTVSGSLASTCSLLLLFFPQLESFEILLITCKLHSTFTRVVNASPWSYLTDTDPDKKAGHAELCDMKKLRLGPSPTSDDRTILEDHSRVMGLFPNDRAKINIRMPFTNLLENLLVPIDLWLTIGQEHSQEMSSLKNQLHDVQQSHLDLQRSHSGLKNQLRGLPQKSFGHVFSGEPACPHDRHRV